MDITVLSVVVAVAAAILISLVVVAVWIWKGFRRKAQRLGYSSVGEYLRAAPSSDEEKRDAVNLALKGVVLCLLGFVLPPLLLIGVFPLFYGARKIAWASLGLGLVDDADQPGT